MTTNDPPVGAGDLLFYLTIGPRRTAAVLEKCAGKHAPKHEASMPENWGGAMGLEGLSFDLESLAGDDEDKKAPVSSWSRQWQTNAKTPTKKADGPGSSRPLGTDGAGALTIGHDLPPGSGAGLGKPVVTSPDLFPLDTDVGTHIYENNLGLGTKGFRAYTSEPKSHAGNPGTIPDKGVGPQPMAAEVAPMPRELSAPVAPMPRESAVSEIGDAGGAADAPRPSWLERNQLPVAGGVGLAGLIGGALYARHRNKKRRLTDGVEDEEKVAYEDPRKKRTVSRLVPLGLGAAAAGLAAGPVAKAVGYNPAAMQAMEGAAASVRNAPDANEALVQYVTRGGDPLRAPAFGNQTGHGFIKTVKEMGLPVPGLKGYDQWDARHYGQFEAGPASAMKVLAEEDRWGRSPLAIESIIKAHGAASAQGADYRRNFVDNLVPPPSPKTTADSLAESAKELLTLRSSEPTPIPHDNLGVPDSMNTQARATAARLASILEGATGRDDVVKRLSLGADPGVDKSLGLGAAAEAAKALPGDQQEQAIRKALTGPSGDVAALTLASQFPVTPNIGKYESASKILSAPVRAIDWAGRHKVPLIAGGLGVAGLGAYLAHRRARRRREKGAALDPAAVQRLAFNDMTPLGARRDDWDGRDRKESLFRKRANPLRDAGNWAMDNVVNPVVDPIANRFGQQAASGATSGLFGGGNNWGRMALIGGGLGAGLGLLGSKKKKLQGALTGGLLGALGGGLAGGAWDLWGKHDPIVKKEEEPIKPPASVGRTTGQYSPNAALNSPQAVTGGRSLEKTYAAANQTAKLTGNNHPVDLANDLNKTYDEFSSAFLPGFGTAVTGQTGPAANIRRFLQDENNFNTDDYREAQWNLHVKHRDLAEDNLTLAKRWQASHDQDYRGGLEGVLGKIHPLAGAGFGSGMKMVAGRNVHDAQSALDDVNKQTLATVNQDQGVASSTGVRSALGAGIMGAPIAGVLRAANQAAKNQMPQEWGWMNKAEKLRGLAAAEEPTTKGMWPFRRTVDSAGYAKAVAPLASNNEVVNRLATIMNSDPAAKGVVTPDQVRSGLMSKDPAVMSALQKAEGLGFKPDPRGLANNPQLVKQLQGSFATPAAAAVPPDRNAVAKKLEDVRYGAAGGSGARLASAERTVVFDALSAKGGKGGVRMVDELSRATGIPADTILNDLMTGGRLPPMDPATAHRLAGVVAPKMPGAAAVPAGFSHTEDALRKMLSGEAPMDPKVLQELRKMQGAAGVEYGEKAPSWLGRQIGRTPTTGPRLAPAPVESALRKINPFQRANIRYGMTLGGLAGGVRQMAMNQPTETLTEAVFGADQPAILSPFDARKPTAANIPNMPAPQADPSVTVPNAPGTPTADLVRATMQRYGLDFHEAVKRVVPGASPAEVSNLRYLLGKRPAQAGATP